MPSDGDRRVVLGRIRGAQGVRGWVKVESYSRPPDSILGYAQWQIERGSVSMPYSLLAGRRHGPGFMVHLADPEGRPLATRDDALSLFDARIAVYRRELEPLPNGEYYWVDLQGLTVTTLDGVVLGVVKRVFETGANDVLVVEGERERLIPFVQGPVVHEVDLDAGRMRVDWDPEF